MGSIDQLVLAPSLVHRLSPALDPSRAMEIEAAVAGPLNALDVHVLLTGGGSTARLRGRMDVRARSFRFVAILDSFYLQSIRATRKSRVNVELSFDGRLVEGGVAGALVVRDASGIIEGLPLRGARIDAQLNGPHFQVKKVLLGVPGAVFDAGGGGTYRDFRVRYDVVVTNGFELRKVPPFFRLMVGLTSLTPGRAVVGSIHRRSGGAIEVTHHAIPPVLRFFDLLVHLLSGRPPHLKVR
jgi:hypothetical protein